MDSKREIEQLDKLMAKVAEDYDTKGETKECCPRCKGKLKYYRAGNSFSISCENQCGVVYNFRGL
ncbi:MAG: hypothetical protein OSJ73_19310 [Lachnospiraceae bacterium]|nr:hypothetical protein [Lachnospiraceae bacterium]